MDNLSQNSAGQSSHLDTRAEIFALVGDLQKLEDYASTLKLPNVAEQIREIIGHIQSKKFSIAVVGEFNRGKSTFINALLGTQILPSDIVPTSATLNRVTYSYQKSAKIVFKAKDGQPERTENISIEQLTDYVTKLTPEAEAISKTVKEAIVYYPLQYSDNYDIIDTPGLSDDATMTEITMGVLPKVDAAIMVIMSQYPFAESESKFLDRLLKHGLESVIFVVTAIDKVRPKDRPRVIEHTKKRIKSRMKKYAKEKFGEGSEPYEQYLTHQGEPRVMGISGYNALQARLNHNPDLFNESGFIEFESYLEQFLAKKGAVALRTQAERVVNFSEQIRVAIAAQAETLKNDPQQFEATYERMATLLNTLRQIGQTELKKIDTAERSAAQNTSERSIQLLAALKQAINDIFNQMEVTADDLTAEMIQAFVAAQNQKIDKAIKEASQSFIETVHQTAQNTILDELKRLRSFAITFDRILQEVKKQFIAIDRDTLGESITATEKLFDHIWLLGKFDMKAGYDEAYLTQNEAEIVERLCPQSIAVQLAHSLPLPQGWLDEIAIDEIKVEAQSSSDSSKSWLSKQKFLQAGKDLYKAGMDLYHVNTFAKDYRAKVFTKFDEQFTIQKVEEEINNYISQSFSRLKQDINSSVDRLQSLMVELRGGKKERIVLSTKHKLATLQEMKTNVQKISIKAADLSGQLVKVLDL